MNRLILILALLTISLHINASERIFNDRWRFMRVEGIDSEADSSFAERNFNDSNWTQVILPHTANIEPYVVLKQWQGVCWYRKLFTLDVEPAVGRRLLRLDGAMNVADVWVNGKHMTTHLGGFLPVVVDMTDALVEGENCIAVRLDNKDNHITGPKPMHLLDFNTYGGLYRNAWLIEKPAIYITDPMLEQKPASGGVFITYPNVSKESALVRVAVNVRNTQSGSAEVKVVNTIYDGRRKVAQDVASTVRIAAGMTADFIAELNLTAPKLWAPHSPALYDVESVVICEGRRIDVVRTRIGVREFRFDGHDLLINGEKYFLRGVNRHQDYPYVGYALSDNAQWRDARKIKDAGFDYVRLSHYPHSPAFMDACDALGLVVLDAIPGWQYQNEDPRFADQVVRTSREMIRRDRNRPSVLAWEVSINETWMPEPLIDRLIAAAREEFPNCYTAGWMKYGYDIYLEARQHRKSNNVLIDKPYNVSEYGDWEYYAQNAGLDQDKWNDLNQEERTSRQLLEHGEVRLLQQATNVQQAHNDNLHTPAYSDGYWVMYDYNRGYADDLEASGVMSLDRQPKFSYYFFQSQRRADQPNGRPMIHIASYWSAQSPLSVRVFSNCQQVELLLNGVVVERRNADINAMSDKLSSPPFTFIVPQFKAGKLTAVGYIDGKKVATHSVCTPLEAQSLNLEVDLSGIELHKNDMVFVRAAVVDKNGTIIRDEQGSVRFSMPADSDCEIVGDNPAKIRAGVATVLVKTGSKSGSVTINAQHSNAIIGKVTMKIN